ncbi:MAG: LacI family DNA-binding transcriptional regulator [Beutenbergiaceae bacterium]
MSTPPERTGASRRRPSVSDVARLAGVSVGTVSNVLNQPDRVAPATRERVQAAITELGFLPNASARQLRSGQISTIGTVVLDVANPFFTEMARGIEDRLSSDDLTLMLASSDENPQREARYLRLFAEHGVRGVLATPSQGSIDGLLALRDLGIPVVLLDTVSPVPELSSVAVDDVRGAALAIDHLLDLGHRHIAFVNGPLTLRQCADRREGVLRALTTRGLDPAQALTQVAVENLNTDAADAAVAALLATGRQRPTAIFCANDLTALGALRALREAQLRVPDQMAVVGYDDVSFAAMLTTPLTSVRQPTHAIGWTAADILLRNGLDGSEHVVFEPELIIRGSSAAG